MKPIKPWNDVSIPNALEGVEILPEWFRSCVAMQHETDIDEGFCICATCNREEGLDLLSSDDKRKLKGGI